MSLIDLGKGLIGKLEKSFDVDSVDRIKYVYTNWVIMGTAFFIFNKNYVGQSVQCWAPKQMKAKWEAYIETYCLIENTYFVPMNETNLPEHSTREAREMIYYQWVPFVLVGMGALLYLPRYLWTQSQRKLGVDLPAITVGLRTAAKKNKDMEIAQLALQYQSRWGSKLAFGLIMTKLLSIVILCSQLIFLNWFLGQEYSFWGFNVLRDILNGRHWQETGHFPRVTFCDVQVREMGGVVHNWTVQCVLMVNMFNEKVFLFLWWWLVVLLFISIINLVAWVFRSIHHQNNVQFVEDLLRINLINVSSSDVDYFVEHTLKRDGCILLRLIADNATVFKAADYVRPLWEHYLREDATSSIYSK